MAEKEQNPLAPASHRLYIEDDATALSAELKKQRHRKYVKCCGCAAALILIQTVIILVLIFTVFRVRDPVINMNSIKISGLALGSTPSPGANLTFVADVSVENPNVASFKFGDTTTTIYYGGAAVGEGRNKAGVARARRTVRMNVAVDMMVEKMLGVGVGRLLVDLASGALPLRSHTRVGGKVEILKIIKKSVVVRLDCNFTVNVFSQTILDQSCKDSISL